VASEVTKVLADNIRYGTGTAANINRPAAGKTGTTDDHTDAWFCGYTPILTTVVWVGYPQGAIPMENVHGIAVAGGTFPAIIWHLFSQRVLRYSPPKDFPEPTSEPEWNPFSGYYAYRSWVTSSDLPPAGTQTQETP
jgi:penicillin-binding protein 1A